MLNKPGALIGYFFNFKLSAHTMKEIKDIISAQQKAEAAGKKTALATVVHVEGSSYRRPGARMLVTEDGVLTGAISGGCLEGDALRKALLAINENKNKLVTYDTTDEDDARFGVQLGCNGIVHILFEPVDPMDGQNPVTLLKLIQEQRRHVVLCTLFAMDQQAIQPGTQFIYQGSQGLATGIALLHPEYAPELMKAVHEAYDKRKTNFRNIPAGDIELTAFIEVIPAAIALYIFGAGNDAMPLVAMGDILGWEIYVIDGRRTHVTSERFPKATLLMLQKAEHALTDISFDDRTAAVLMTHNYNYDIEVLSQITKTTCPYIGVLGPKKKMDRMLDELAAAGKGIDKGSLKNVYSPVGLDLGAETAEEIALSISAEIKAVLSGKNAGFLREKQQAIHN